MPKSPSPGPSRRKADSCYTAQMAIYNEEFQNLLRICTSLINALDRPTDGESARKVLHYVLVMSRSKNLEVIKHTTEFFEFFVRILQLCADTQPMEYYDKWFAGKKKDVNLWLHKQQSYWAMKHMDDGTTVTYMAVAKNRCAGWQDMGLKGIMNTCE